MSKQKRELDRQPTTPPPAPKKRTNKSVVAELLKPTEPTKVQPVSTGSTVQTAADFGDNFESTDGTSGTDRNYSMANRKAKSELVKVTFKFTTHERDKLRDYAKKHGMDMTELVKSGLRLAYAELDEIYERKLERELMEYQKRRERGN